MVRQCGKMALLDRMLPLLRKRGHKILIFSQVGAAVFSQPCCATCGEVQVAVDKVYLTLWQKAVLWLLGCPAAGAIAPREKISAGKPCQDAESWQQCICSYTMALRRPCKVQLVFASWYGRVTAAPKDSLTCFAPGEKVA